MYNAFMNLVQYTSVRDSPFMPTSGLHMRCSLKASFEATNIDVVKSYLNAHLSPTSLPSDAFVKLCKL